MNHIEIIHNELTEARKLLTDFISEEANLTAVSEAAKLIIDCIDSEGTVFSCGNGGSACDASHFAEEMTGRFREDRKPMRAMAISDIGHITCTANDYGFDSIFSRFLRAHGKKGDVLLAISTSGNSNNVLNAAEFARSAGIKVVGLTGNNGGTLANLCDVEIRVNHNGYSDRIQEVHIKIIHCLITLIESSREN